jgi:hypothetical protein
VVNWLISLALFALGLVPVTYLLTNAYLSRRRDRGTRVPPAPAQAITTIVPVHGEEPERFRATVRSVRRQGCRVLVVGDGCVEPYRSLALSEGAEFVGLAERSGKKRALATGLDRVTTPLVLFVDSDTVLPEGAASRLSTYFVDGVGGVGANLLHHESSTIAAGCAEFIERAREVVLRAMSSRGNVLYLDGACMMFRTALIRSYVGSEEFQNLRVLGRVTRLGDDWLLTDHVLNQGQRTVKAYDVGAVTHPPDTLADFVRQNVRWTRSSWIRLGRYLRGSGPRNPGRFYRLELIGTYALPLVAFALLIARLPLFVHLFEGFVVRTFVAVSHGVIPSLLAHHSSSWSRLFFPAQTIVGLVSTGAFVGAVVGRLPPDRRLRTLACGLLGSGLLLLTAIFGLVTFWRSPGWRGPTSGPQVGGEVPTTGLAGSVPGGPLLRR